MTADELAALSVIRATYSRPITYSGTGIGSAASAAIPSDNIADAFEGPGDVGREITFELMDGILPRDPLRGDQVMYDGQVWVVIDITARRDIGAWVLFVMEVERFDRLVIIERMAAGLDDYGEATADPSWVERLRAIAMIAPGKGEERREAAQLGGTLATTFKIPWSADAVATSVASRLRFPVTAIDPDDWPVWEISSVVPVGLNEAVEITATRSMA